MSRLNVVFVAVLVIVVIATMGIYYSCSSSVSTTTTKVELFVKEIGSTKEVTQMMRVSEILEFQELKNSNGTSDFVRPVVVTDANGIHWEAYEFKGDVPEELEIGDLVYVTMGMTTSNSTKEPVIHWIRIDYGIDINEFTKQKE